MRLHSPTERSSRKTKPASPSPAEIVDRIWQGAAPRSVQGASDTGRVTLALTVLRRLDCLLEPTRPTVLAALSRWGDRLSEDELEARLNDAAGLPFHNRSPLDFVALRREPAATAAQLRRYLSGFSKNIRAILGAFELEPAISEMEERGVLHEVVSRFAALDLHRQRVPEQTMLAAFDELRRRLEDDARTFGRDSSTPPDLARLMVGLLFSNDDRRLRAPGPAPTLLDPACGSGGLLMEAQAFVRERGDGARLRTYGQEISPHAWAVAACRLLLGEEAGVGSDAFGRVRLGDSLTEDRFVGKSFDYLLTNPPLGGNRRYGRDLIVRERDEPGWAGRFGAGLPRTGELLFVRHAVGKFGSEESATARRGSRLGILLTGSSLTSGRAGSPESDLRRRLIENDWLEAVIALPERVLYDTGIGPFLWIVTNRKDRRREGRIQLIDARDRGTEDGRADRPRARGRRRRHCSEAEIRDLLRLHERFEETEARSRIVPNEALGYLRVVVERPLRLTYRMTGERKFRFLNACPELVDDLQALDRALGRERQRDWNDVRRRIEEVLAARDTKWTKPQRRIFRRTFTETDPAAVPVRDDAEDAGYEPDPKLRSYEEAPLAERVETWFDRCVRPHAPDAWMTRSRQAVGYRIRFEDFFGGRTPAHGSSRRAQRRHPTRAGGRPQPGSAWRGVVEARHPDRTPVPAPGRAARWS